MYIKKVVCISPQDTIKDNFPQTGIVEFDALQCPAIEPDYAGLIPRGLLRRMGKAIRMGVGAGLPLLTGNKDIEGIIIGTANGGLEDCIKFLNQIVKYNEGTLTPTNFVQSTPNSLGGTLALMGQNSGYNVTHVNKGLSFESALMDAQMLIEAGDAKTLLVGCIEEISTYNTNIYTMDGFLKKEALLSSELLNSETKGTISGEGATMFVVDQNGENALARIIDTGQITHPNHEDLLECLNALLRRNQLKMSDLDAVLLGYNGDQSTDHWYKQLSNSFDEGTGLYSYKNLVGDFPTVSGFALFLVLKLIELGEIPKEMILKGSNRSLGKVLIYNHHRGVQHGFILVESLA